MEQSEVTVQDPTVFFSLTLLQGGHFPAEQQQWLLYGDAEWISNKGQGQRVKWSPSLMLGSVSNSAALFQEEPLLTTLSLGLKSLC